MKTTRKRYKIYQLVEKESWLGNYEFFALYMVTTSIRQRMRTVSRLNKRGIKTNVVVEILK